jgi:hypothetical protein
MDRDKCMGYLASYSKGILPRKAAEDVLTSYVCDRGYASKKDYVPLLMIKADLNQLLECAFNYYKLIYNIFTLYRPNPYNSSLLGMQAILFY